ncbi:hypothetical protein, partial [Marinimicrobium sp. ARAG 43.8]|uniref:hypothetical protein n=1 Tax=Marinimicrobium sp. ARAG 43.8 TaxID=3418719 RepID=UPI003CEFE621
GGGAANDSSVGTGNSHSDDSESRNGRGTSLDEEEKATSGPGKWQTTDVDKQGFRNLTQIIAIRLRTLGEEGRLWGSDGKDFEGTVQDVTQTWTSLSTAETQGLQENGLISVEREYGEKRVIRQMYLEGGDDWKTNGKSWYWQPVVPNTVFEFKEP